MNAIAYCLGEAKASGADVDRVAFYEKPFLKFERLLETYLAFAPRGFESFRRAMPLWISEKLFQRDHLLREARRDLSGARREGEAAAFPNIISRMPRLRSILRHFDRRAS